MTSVDLKIVLLGKHSVGKTALVERYLHGRFKSNTVTTVGAAFGAKKMKIGSKEITVGVWDTAGQERYESMSRIYYRGARAALVCWDMTDPDSFKKVQFWIDELMSNEPSCEIYIVGTKYDLIEDGTPRAVSKDEVNGYSSRVNAKSVYTSAKSGAGIEELFLDIAQGYIKNPPEKKKVAISPISSPPEEQKSGCPC